MQQDKLLLYYEEELTFIRYMIQAYAQAHPELAGRLGVNSPSVNDPHVARLIEAFSLANAHTRYKLIQEFPEIVVALLEALQPDALAPIPSMAIAQFQIEDVKTAHSNIVPPDTLLISEPVQGQPCTFKTRYPLKLLPITIQYASLTANLNAAPRAYWLKPSAVVLCLSLICAQSSIAINSLGIDSLRFFINAPLQDAYELYGLLMQQAHAIAIANSPQDAGAVFLSVSQLQPVGFKQEESMLPANKRVFFGYHLLREFLVFPKKFLFFDLMGLAPYMVKNTGNSNKLCIYFYLEKSDSALEKNIGANSFALNCTPVVNLFEQPSEPICYDHTKHEYPIIPSAAYRPEAVEIYAVHKVMAVDDQGEAMVYAPCYGVSRSMTCGYYHVLRKMAREKVGHHPVIGSEMFLSLAHCNPASLLPLKQVVTADLLCTNGDLPAQLPFGGHSSGLSIQPGSGLPVAIKINILTPLTACRRALVAGSINWRYVSQLALNHLSITEDKNGIEVLKALLTLYGDNGDSHKNMLQGLLGISSQADTTFYPSSSRTANRVWSGTAIRILVDETKFAGYGLYLFGQVLSHFFGLYHTVNLFSQLTIKNQQGEELRYAARIGDKVLL